MCEAYDSGFTQTLGTGTRGVGLWSASLKERRNGLVRTSTISYPNS